MWNGEFGIIRAKALSYVTQPFRAEIRNPNSELERGGE
jgi:hypothetical protein